ncbi:hypothetical protein HDU84_001267 [Entophlyctis sp. JEL0112]|nr:hypothetical protein HDU84_001267 [Entophlyctis sp. JEL0112]
MAATADDASDDSHFLDALLPDGSSIQFAGAADATFAPDLMSVDSLMGLGLGGGMLPLFPSVSGLDPKLPSPPHMGLHVPPLPAMPAASPSVRTILASDTSREALALLEGPVKKKPGRKKKDASDADHTTMTALNAPPPASRTTPASVPCQSQQLVTNKKRKIAPMPSAATATHFPAKLSPDSQPPELSLIDTKLQISPSPPPQTLLAISPTPAINSKRKISVSDTDYLTPSLLEQSGSVSGTSSPGGTVPSLDRKPSLPFIPPPLPTQAPVLPLTKHQERMMKNRASADESRRKHKDHVEKLENMCRELVKENEILRNRVVEIESAWELLLVQQQLQLQQLQQQQQMLQQVTPTIPPQQDLSSVTGSSPVSLDCELGMGDVLIPELGMTNAPSPNSLFEMFFGGGDFTTTGAAADSGAKAVKGTVLMAFLFSFSMILFPSSLFQKSSTNFFASQHSASPVITGISHYTPRIFLPLQSAPEQHRTLDGRAASPLLDASSRVTRTRDGRLVVNSYLGIEGTTPFLTLGPSMVTGAGDSSWRSATTATARRTHMSGGEKVFATATDNSGVADGTLWIAELLSRVAGGVSDGSVRSGRVEAVMGLLFEGDAAAPRYTEPVKSAQPADRVIRLPASTVISGNGGVQDSRHEAPTMSWHTKPAATITTDVVRRGPNSVLVVGSGEKVVGLEDDEEASETIIIEEVDATMADPKDSPPIKSDSERASVKRRELARAAQAAAAASSGVRVGDAVGLPVATGSPPLAPSPSSSLMFAHQSPANAFDEEKYCPIANGPVLSLIADLGEDGDGGLRLMLDVQVVGAKLVRY